mmetsp:Transcript_38869/g.90108  ORF Transcript_38869/g.90108 Transcript_38869/m.90108 type:complete len:121 (-) Transcript_38869:91-453(-)
MARGRSPLAALLVALALACLPRVAFVPAPAQAPRQGALVSAGNAAQAAALTAVVSAAPLAALAEDEEEEGFDVRILAVLALPLLAISWALLNVWRVAFRQVVRFSDSTLGTSKVGLRPED